MKNLKHLFTALLLLCATVATAHDFEVGGIYYNITSTTDFTVEVTYRGTSYSEYSNEYTGSVVIPESVTYSGRTYSVTSIGGAAFRDCRALTSVVIPNSVTSIGERALYNCRGLTSVEIPNSVTNIGSYAFYDCYGLKKVINFSSLKFSKGSDGYGYVAYYADTVINAPNGSVEGDFVFGVIDGVNTLCGYIGAGGDVTLPADYKGENYAIGADVFKNNTSLTSVEIPNSVTSIGNNAFYDCSGLKEVHISDLSAWFNIAFASADANPLYYAHNLYLNGELVTDLVIPDGITEIKDYAFYKCTGLTSVVITNSVTSIGSYAFSGCSGLTSVEIPNSVTSIGGAAFRDCSGLTNVVIPNSVIGIGWNAFSGCSGLTGVVIPNSVTSIGSSAFDGTAWYNNQPDGVVYAGKVLYKYKGTMSLNTSIAIKDGTLGIGGAAFDGCSGLTSVVIPNSVTSIGGAAFWDCSGLTSVVIPNSVTSIGYATFYNCSGLTSVVIPNSVTSIGEWAFYECSGLASVEIPNSVTSIGGAAFYGCSGLKEVHISDLSAWCGIDFNFSYGYSANPLSEEGSLYLNGELVTNLVIPDGVTEIKDYAFYGCSALASVEIPNSVTSIGSSAFRGCRGLTSVVIGNGVTSIGDYAFYNCSGLKKVINFSSLTFSKGSTYYGEVAYYAETVINAPNGPVEGDFVFAVIDGVNTLCGYIGAGGDVTLPADYNGENYAIGSYAFSGCRGLTSIVIPNSVTSIGESAFNGCSNVETLYISNAIESIGDYAFAGCEKIKEIKVGREKPIRGSVNIFADAVYDNAILYIPAGSKSLYDKREPWNIFFYIVEMDFTGIDEVKGENGKVKGVYYDLNGRAVERPANGLYIKNGKKVFVK